MKYKKDIVIVFCICFLVSSFGLIPFMGIPGALVIEVFDEPMKSLGLYPQEDLGPGIWGLAILITLLWPASVFVSYVLAFYSLKKLPKVAKYLVWALLPLIWAVALMWFFTKDYEEVMAEQDARMERYMEELKNLDNE